MRCSRLQLFLLLLKFSPNIHKGFWNVMNFFAKKLAENNQKSFQKKFRNVFVLDKLMLLKYVRLFYARVTNCGKLREFDIRLILTHRRWCKKKYLLYEVILLMHEKLFGTAITIKSKIFISPTVHCVKLTKNYISTKFSTGCKNYYDN